MAALCNCVCVLVVLTALNANIERCSENTDAALRLNYLVMIGDL